jgi:hypothetical protein
MLRLKFLKAVFMEDEQSFIEFTGGFLNDGNLRAVSKAAGQGE